MNSSKMQKLSERSPLAPTTASPNQFSSPSYGSLVKTIPIRPTRENRGLGAGELEATKRAEQMYKTQLENVWWLLYFYDRTGGAYSANHGSIVLSFAERKRAKSGDIVKVRCAKKHPVTKLYVWDTLLCNRGHEFYVKNRLHELTVHVKANQPPLGLNPGIVFIDDPELTAHESVDGMIYCPPKETGVKRSIVFGSGPENALDALEQDVAVDDHEVYISSCPVIDGASAGKIIDELEDEMDQASETLPPLLEKAILECDDPQFVPEVPRSLASSTPGNPRKTKTRGKVMTPDQVKDLVKKNKERHAIDSLTEVVGSLKVSVDTMTNTVLELKHCVSGLANRNMQEVQQFGNCMKNLTSQVQRLGVMLPEPKNLSGSAEVLILIPKGPDKDGDLATTEGKTPEILARNAGKRLWTDDEMTVHMLSPKRSSKNTRTDFSPERKNCFKKLYQLKYGDRWPICYGLGKISLNNRGNELAAGGKRLSMQLDSNEKENNEQLL